MMIIPNGSLAANIGEVKSISHWHKVYQKNEKFQKVEYFYTDWCIYCPQQTAIIEQLAKEYPKVLFMKINGAKLRRPEVQAYPTVIINGKIFSGVTSKERLKLEIK